MESNNSLKLKAHAILNRFKKNKRIVHQELENIDGCIEESGNLLNELDEQINDASKSVTIGKIGIGLGAGVFAFFSLLACLAAPEFTIPLLIGSVVVGGSLAGASLAGALANNKCKKQLSSVKNDLTNEKEGLMVEAEVLKLLEKNLDEKIDFLTDFIYSNKDHSPENFLKLCKDNQYLFEDEELSLNL